MQNSMSTSYFIEILGKYKKQIFLFVLLSTIAGTVTCLLIPKKYLSSTIVVPANPKTSDKNFLYGNQVLEPQSAFGMEEDLDRLLTNLKLYSNFSKLVDSFQLITHFKIKTSDKAKANAVEELVANTTIYKTENGAVQINVWDKDKTMSANLANALVSITQKNSLEQNQQINKGYLSNLEQSLLEKESQLKLLDTIQNPITKEIKKKVITEAYTKDLSTIEQLKLAVHNTTNSVIVLEKAFPSQKHDKPKLSFWIIASFLSSIAFGVFLVILLSAMQKK